MLIDAAHALGQLDVDLASLDADFFVSNCHKWLAGPRYCCVCKCQPWATPVKMLLSLRGSMTCKHSAGCAVMSSISCLGATAGPEHRSSTFAVPNAARPAGWLHCDKSSALFQSAMKTQSLVCL